jgi:hypothetical protein
MATEIVVTYTVFLVLVTTFRIGLHLLFLRAGRAIPE